MMFTTEEVDALIKDAVDEAIRNYKISQLPSQQRQIFDHLTEWWATTGEISKLSGLASKNVSQQLKQMSATEGLIMFQQKGKLKSWKLAFKPDFWVECNVCKQQLKNWSGSTPCCGSIAYIVDKSGNSTGNMSLFASINGGNIQPTII